MHDCKCDFSPLIYCNLCNILRYITQYHIFVICFSTQQNLRSNIIMHKFTRRQVNSLLALGGITVVLFIGIFFLPWVGGAYPAYPEPDISVEAPIPHNRFRSARTSSQPHLNWELNIGGSGNETVIATFKLLNEIIVFGNTTSTDYDFYGHDVGYFVVILNSNGTPIAYRTYAGTLETVHMVVDVEGVDDGFVLSVNTINESLVKLTNLNGAESHRADVRRANSSHERILDIIIDDTSATSVFHAVIEHTSPLNQDHKSLRVALLNSSLGITHEQLFTHRSGYSLEYVRAIAGFNSFRLFANARCLVSRQTFLAAYSWRPPAFSEARTINVPDVARFETIDVLPNHARLNSYVALIRTEDSRMRVVDLYNNMSSVSTRPLPGNYFSVSASIFSGTQNFYAFERRQGGIGAMARFNKQGVNVVYPPLNGFDRTVEINTVKCVALYSGNSTRRTIAVGRTADQIQVSDIRTQGVANMRSFVAEGLVITNSIYVPDSGVLLIGQSSSAGGAVGGHFGGTDLWIGKISL